MATTQSIRPVVWSDWSGGINTRDTYEFEHNQIGPDSSNVSIIEGGKAIRRRTMVSNTTLLPAAPAIPTLSGGIVVTGLWFTYAGGTSTYWLQIDNTLYRASVSGGSWTSTKVFSNTNSCDITVFNGEVVIVQVNDGVFTWDGATLTNRSTVATGATIAIWQNKVWVANGTRVWWSNAGDAHTWTTGTDFVDIREKDSNSVTKLLGVGSSLIAFKESSMYRFTDSTTGSYQTIDWQHGAGYTSTQSVPYSQQFTAVALPGSEVLTVNPDGVFRGTAFGSLRKISDHIPEIDCQSGWPTAMTLYGTKVLIAVPDFGNLYDFFEYDVLHGYFLKHSIPVTAGTRPAVIGMTVYSPVGAGIDEIHGLTADSTPTHYRLRLSNLFTELDPGSAGIADPGCTRTVASFDARFVQPNNGLMTRVKSFYVRAVPFASSTNIPTYGISFFNDIGGEVVHQFTPLSTATFQRIIQRFNPYIGAREVGFSVFDSSTSAPTSWTIYDIKMEFLSIEA